jgi:hypothetical protein
MAPLVARTRAALTHPSVLCGLFSAAFLGSNLFAAQTPAFLPVTHDQSGKLKLSLQGEANTTYVIEASGDLSHWRTEFTGASSAAGILDYLLTLGPSVASYYRARQESPIEDLVLVPRADPNYSAATLISTNGGFLSITNTAGVAYILTVPPLSVAAPIGISMTLVTNIEGFPLTAGFGEAVTFQPDGFEFESPAILEIRYPTNIAGFEVASYSFSADGRELFLTPDRVTSNSVIIPVMHFSGAGSGFGGKQAASAFARKALQNDCDRFARQIGEELLDARAAGELNGAALASFPAKAQDFYDQVLKPREAAALQDCALAKDLANCMFRMGRAVQLLGGEANFMHAFPCAVFENCIKEAKAICPANPAEATRQFLQAHRAAAFLAGGDCNLQDFDSFMKECQPEWYGSISYSESGGTNETQLGAAGYKVVATTDSAVAGDAIFLPIGNGRERQRFLSHAYDGDLDITLWIVPHEGFGYQNNRHCKPEVQHFWAVRGHEPDDAYGCGRWRDQDGGNRVGGGCHAVLFARWKSPQ